MIIHNDNSDLMNEYLKAREKETVAIKALLAHMSSASPSKSKIIALSEAMENAHDKSMDIRSMLEAVRLDK